MDRAEVLDRARVQGLYDRLKNLNKESDIYSLIDTLPGASEEAKNFQHHGSFRTFFGAHLISEEGNGRRLWLGMLESEDSGLHYVTVYRKEKTLIFQISSGIWKYSPTKQDGKNKERKKRFASHMKGTEIKIPFPGADVSVDCFLDCVFDIAKCCDWSAGLGPEPPPRLAGRWR